MEGGVVQNGRPRQMKTNVGAVNAAAAAQLGTAPRPVETGKGKRPAPQVADMPEITAVRLVIEEDGQSGSFIYKTLDRITGEVLSQYPREEVLKMLSRRDYSAGDVIKTRA
jgi:flagellar protein FlaG